MNFFKTRPKSLLGLALLLVAIVSLSSCELFEYHYPEALIKATNVIGFQELWSVEVGYSGGYALGGSRRSLLAADLDGDGVEELLVDTEEANRFLVVRDGRVVDELHLQVPGRAYLELSEVVEGTRLAKVLSTGMNLSLVDLTTGEVVRALGEVSGDITWGDRLFSEDINDDGAEELLISQYLPKNAPERVVTARDVQGRQMWRASTSLSSILYFGDLDGDGRKELLTPTGTMIDSEDGSVRSIKKNYESALFYAGDIDGDGKVELVAGRSGADTTVGVYDLDGRKRWGYPLYDVRRGVVGDVNGDGKKEIAVFSRDPNFGSMATADYWVFLFDAQGELLWNHKVNAEHLYPGAFADINGDGKDELMFFEAQFDRPRILHAYGSKE